MAEGGSDPRSVWRRDSSLTTKLYGDTRTSSVTPASFGANRCPASGSVQASEKAQKAVGRRDRAGGRIGRSAGRAPCPGRALKLQKKAARVDSTGEPGPIIAKIREEADEIAAAITAGDRQQIAGEIGDLLFAVVNLARQLDVDPESALRTTNVKFERRFGSIEQVLAARGKTPAESMLVEMDALWDEAKQAEEDKKQGPDRQACDRLVRGFVRPIGNVARRSASQWPPQESMNHDASRFEIRRRCGAACKPRRPPRPATPASRAGWPASIDRFTNC